jgi:hypothetical protein
MGENANGTVWTMVPDQVKSPNKTQILGPTVLSLVVSGRVKSKIPFNHRPHGSRIGRAVRTQVGANGLEPSTSRM